MLLKIKVKPRSSKQGIEKINGEYIIKLKSPPKDNKANIELIRLLSKHFNVSTADVKIKKGLSSRNKIVKIVEIIKIKTFK